ncbi:MAG: hypothetical protein Q4F95_07645 [Oscillospiraceae bacterium]|nr:hypothetical protein [Oscillospiraceae bacterium]
MKKIKFLCCAVVLLMLSASGCSGKSTTTVSENPNSGSSETVQKGQEGIGSSYTAAPDWSVCEQNTYNMFKNGDYPELDVSITSPKSSTDLFNIIIVAKDRPEDQNNYIKWAEDCLKSINEEARKQNPDFAPSADGYYGGVFDVYDVMMTCTCNDDVLSIWPVNQKIAAGSNTPISLTDEKLDLSGLDKGLSIDTTTAD